MSLVAISCWNNISFFKITFDNYRYFILSFVLLKQKIPFI